MLALKLENANLKYFEKFKKNVVGKMNPKGVTVHYTGSGSLEPAIESLLKKNLGYHLIIDKDATVYQLADFNQKLWHSGKALWNGLSPNSHHIGISLVSWGRLNYKDGKFVNWAGKEVKKTVNRFGHVWDPATEEQEEKLYQTLQQLVQRGVHFENICGHSECALPKGRKDDIGGVISMKMEHIRIVLGKELPLTNNIA